MLLLPLLSLPNALSNFVQATVRAVRIKDFLILDQLERVPRVALTEKKKNDTTSNAVEEKTGDKNLGKKLALHLENSSYSWDENATVKTLLNVQMDVYRGNICSIIGHTGCGKSSLISAMLGDIPLSLPTINPTSSSKKRKKSAFVSIHGSVSYVPQQAWIFNATVKGNILFGLEFDPDLYERAITLANLKKDLAMFPAGEETEIGEKGVNLSGGQKQRVSIARAIYADADVIILDDPLSALDAHVGAAVFSSLKDVLCNEMGKTIILATNQLQFASLCDRIVVMDHGSIVENGTNDELLNITDGVHKKLNATRHTDDDTTKEESKGEKKTGEIS
jgi:ABC-type multidrug transport system fused ATPase/permease subunit